MNGTGLSLRLDDNLTLHLLADGQEIAQVLLRIWRGQEDLLRGADQESAAHGDHVSVGRFSVPGHGSVQVTVEAASIQGGTAARLAWTVTNLGPTPLEIDRFAAPELRLSHEAFPPSQPLWTMQGAAVKWGQDFAFPLAKGYSRDNYLGHLQDAEGGGIPVAYVWSAQRGLALMHLDPGAADWYLPVVSDETISARLEQRQTRAIPPGASLGSLPVVVSLHQGDFFDPLDLYRRLMEERGLQSPPPTPADYEPAWCSWGYEFDVRPSEMLGVLPKLRDLGIRWLTLDDRWFDAYGDWNPRSDTFPLGAEDLRHMNATIHDAGAFSTLWWYPLCVEDGRGEWDSHRYVSADLYRKHPDWVVLNADGSVARNNRHLAMLCPGVPAVRQQVEELTRRFIVDWGFDGHKLDNIYTMPPCHNPAHHHGRPEESIEGMGEAYRIIFELTRALRPDSVTQICPCGTPISAHLLPFTDQTVTADPTSSRQIRQRIKFYKALVGPRAAVFADHVELSDGGRDFASEIGPGGVPGTKFVWPADREAVARLKEDWSLTRQAEALFKRWFEIYREHRLAEGEYVNLYDLGFDRPETHHIRQGETLYYAFFADDEGASYRGPVALRGLGPTSYRVSDIVQGVEVGRVKGPGEDRLEVEFDGALLVVAHRESKPGSP